MNDEKSDYAAAIERLVVQIDSQSRALLNKIMNLRGQIEAHEIQELRGVKVWLAQSSLNRLFVELGLLKDLSFFVDSQNKKKTRKIESRII